MHAGFEGFAAADDGLGAGDDHGAAGDDHAAVGVAADEFAGGGVEDGGGGGDDHAGGDDRTLFHDGALIDAAVAADEGAVLDDRGHGPGGLQDAADLGRCADVDVLPHLRAGADGHVGIDHRAFAHVRAHIDISRGHDDGAGGEVGAAADAGPARNDPDAVFGGELPHRESGLVVEGELSFGHVGDGAELKPGENHFLYPFIDNPLAVNLFRYADLAFFQSGDDFVESFEGYFHNSSSVLAMSSSVFWLAGTSGRRSSFCMRPRRAMAALPGMGFGSMKRCLNSGIRR